jgi:hypothetical protein
MTERRYALVFGLLAGLAAVALPATACERRDTREDCDRGPENCAKGQPGPPPIVATRIPVARFDCYDFRPGPGRVEYAAALNRAFELPSGRINPHVGPWRCREVGQPGESCYSAGGVALDLARAGVRPGERAVLEFEVVGDCADFLFSTSPKSFKVTGDGWRCWFVQPLESRTLNFRIRTRGRYSASPWGSFFDVRLPR